MLVVGILIALSNSIWKEDRKKDESLNAIYLIIKEDLSNDLLEIDSFTKKLRVGKKTAFEAVLNTKLTKEDWVKNPWYIEVIGGYKDFAINLRGFDLLKMQSNVKFDSRQNLSSKINLFYNQHIVEIDVDIMEVGESFEKHHDDMMI